MEAKRLSSNYLPEELVANIIAMMPFPSIFKARMLSRTWLARFSPIKPLDDEKEQVKRATRSQGRKSFVSALQKQVGAAAFQKQVLEQSANWPIFFLSKFDWSDSWAYEPASHTWRNLPSLSFLPLSIRQQYDDLSIRQFQDQISTAGALLFFCDRPRYKQEKLYIANIFTRSWKVLPPRPNFGPESYLRHAHFVPNPSMQTYKLISLFDIYRYRSYHESYLYTYDSKSNAWSSKKLAPTGALNPFCARWPHRGLDGQKLVHLNGVVYWMEGKRKLVALDCEEGTLTELPLSGPLDGIIFTSQQLVVCNSSLVMVLTLFIDSAKAHRFMKVDVGSGRLWEIAMSNPLGVNCWGSRSREPVGHGACIYCGFNGKLTYISPQDKWNFMDASMDANLSPDIPNSFWDPTCKPFVFEPGLNLFMPV